ncbi:Cna protein B-type domain protein [Microbacterium azadirachtae]|uniref:Cna protein B-type domain protein n=1 Tax=Microbacterium azadirachtae TaxID=582680 RepID=A0A0F0L0B7_9MICO|nr:carboxypeptidase-like regulatory domain-containing protein [Microbacterium azadirachtae]KJL25785.1 Cna protein B-type domain protein [Microbacterium azadirachtae]
MSAGVSTRRRWKGALTALIAAALMFTGVGAAAAADTLAATGGSIAGVVTNEADGSPIAGIFVQAQNDDASSIAGATTGPDGSYRIDGLQPGAHRVHFLTLGTSYISEYWNNATSYFQAAVVYVQDGVVATGIDAALSSGGTISGVVTREDGTPVVGEPVSAAASGLGGGFSSAITDSSGAYTIQGLPADSYVVNFSTTWDGLVGEYWNDAADYFSATRVPVAAGGAVTGIDAVLTAGGSVQGVVTKASDGSVVANGWVAVLDANGNSVAQGVLSPDGTYRIEGIRPGDYKVKFSSNDPSLVPQYWAGAATAAAATAVTVVAGQTVSGIDAALQSLPAQISGTVTRASDGAPVAGISVTASGAGGYYWATTDDMGAYRISAAPGQYTVEFRDPYQAFVSQWWSGATSAQDATPVTLAEGSQVTGIDARLDATRVIRGTVLLDGSTDLRGRSSSIAVIAESDGRFAGMSYVHPDGTYTLTIAPGTYTVHVEGTEGFAWAVAPQYYSHAATAAEATPVVLSGDADTTGIDFDLSSLTAKVALSSGTAHPGETVHVTASGFAPRDPVKIELHSVPVLLASVTAGADGTVDTTVTLPPDVAAGEHQIVLTGAMSTLTGSAALTVPGGTGTGSTGGATGGAASPSGAGTSSAAQLAATGSEVPFGEMGLAALLLLAGAVLVRIRRRQQA